MAEAEIGLWALAGCLQFSKDRLYFYPDYVCAECQCGSIHVGAGACGRQRC